MKKKIFIIFVLLPLSLLLSQTNSEKPFPFTKIGLNLYRIEVDVNSIIASIGPDGVLLCDVGDKSKGARVMATVRELGGEKIGYIIDTHWHVDHTGGNKCFGKEALIIAHENVRKRLSEDKYLAFWDEEHPAFPDYALPDVVFSDRMTLHLNGEDIEITHLSCGHTDGDAVVYFRKSNILHVGDCLFTNGFPAIDFEMGGSVEGFAENLKKIAAMMPADVTIIAGHGPDYTIKELRAYETMVRSSLDAVRDAMQKSMTLEAMLQADLLREWTEYSHGFFSCDEWIKMIHQSLIHNSSISSKMVEPWPRLKGPYLGQKPPGITPEVFAPGVVSTNLDEFGCTMSPDGGEFYFTRTYVEPRRHTIMVCRLEANGWTAPEIAPFSGQHSEAEPNLSPDGSRLFFGRPESGIWMAERSRNGWHASQHLLPGMFATASNNGTLYYTDVSRGMDKCDIVKSRYVNGQYMEKEALKGSLNSTFKDAHPYVAPDESYIIFDSIRPGGMGGNDLYISFGNMNGLWSKAINLGEKINSPEHEAIPFVSPEGEFLFYSTKGDIYWVDAKVIEDLKPKELK